MPGGQGHGNYCRCGVAEGLAASRSGNVSSVRLCLLAGGAVGRSPASAGGSPYHPHGAGQAAQGRLGGGGGHGHGHGHANGGGHDDEDGYSDDFEEDDEGGDEVLQQRNRIIQNVEGEECAGPNDGR